jgi:hypothetical protein
LTTSRGRGGRVRRRLGGRRRSRSRFQRRPARRGVSRLKDGARLLALHRNQFWNAGPERGLVLDARLCRGPGARQRRRGDRRRQAGPCLHELALAELGRSARDVVMIGDNVLNDLVGAARAGCRTCLVRAPPSATTRWPPRTSCPI